MTTTNPGARTPNTIVLIHGLWLTALSWEKWVAHEGLPGHRAKLAGHGGRRRGPSARPVGDHGFVLPFASLKAALPGLKNPFAQHEAVALTPEQFNYGFTNALSAGETLPLYERYAVPGPNHVLFQASLANFNPHAATTVNFASDERAPLLLIAGGTDHTVPASVTRANFELFNKSDAMTAYRDYPERTQWTIGQDGWEAVAAFASVA